MCVFLYAVFGQDFTSSPPLPVVPAFQNETCFSISVVDNNVSSPNYFIILSLVSFQIRRNVLFLPSPLNVNITVDDDQGTKV